MKKISSVLICIAFSICSLAQTEGYAFSSVGIRIYDVSASVLAEVNRIPDKEKRLVQIDCSTLSQSDFNGVIAKLKWVKKLSIEKSSGLIDDINAVGKLKDLEVFHMSNFTTTQNPISLAPLRDLTALKELIISDSQISGADTLRTLVNLQSVSFENSDINTLGFLASMPQLEKLNIAGKHHTFQNYDTLRTLTDLRSLDISENPQATTENVEAFSDFTMLTNVRIASCPLSSLSFLYSSASRLQTFDASSCPNIANFDLLMRASKLKKVNISNTAAKTITFAKNKVDLKDLRLANTEVESIEALASSINLEWLDISNTKVQDISALVGMTKLKRLLMSHCSAVADVKALSGCESLKVFDCSHSQLASIDGLERCTNLSVIDLSYTMVTDLKPLFSAKKIERLTLDKANAQQVQLDVLKKRSPLIIINLRSEVVEEPKATEEPPAEEEGE